MRLSRTNMPLASSDSVISQLTYAAFLDNLAPHLRAENPDHKLFCHSQPQNPPQLSKSGLRLTVHTRCVGGATMSEPPIGITAPTPCPVITQRNALSVSDNFTVDAGSP